MSYASREVVTVTTDTNGDATAYSGVVTGKLSQIRWVKPGSGGITGATFAITAEATGETLWGEASISASATRAPRQATHTTDGAASLYAAAGVAVNDKIALANDRVKIVVSGGGSVLTGTFHIVLE
jgi:hypothetical protein